jgi:DNA-binding transcriptional MerR regulator
MYTLTVMNNPAPETLPLADFCALVDLPVRTVRFYIQKGLLDRPVGETRAARYGPGHVEQALLIKKWSQAGLSLERIHDLLRGAEPVLPVRPRQPGEVAVVSHLLVAEGIELLIDPARAGLSPEQLREFTRSVLALFQDLQSPQSQSVTPAPQGETP